MAPRGCRIPPPGAFAAVAVAALALLAGCASTQTLRITDGADEATVADAPGLRVEARAETCGDAVCLTTIAHNAGPGTYHIETGCSEPWREWMSRQGQPVTPRPPLDQCLAFGTRPFAPGESLERQWTWDGRLWSEGERRLEAAPAGEYDWRITFTAYREADGSAGARSAAVAVRLAAA